MAGGSRPHGRTQTLKSKLHTGVSGCLRTNVSAVQPLGRLLLADVHCRVPTGSGAHLCPRRRPHLPVPLTTSRHLVGGPVGHGSSLLVGSLAERLTL